MSEVAISRPSEFTKPIVRVEADEDEDFPTPPDRPIKPIHALQVFFLPFLLVYLFISIIMAIVSGNHWLLSMSLLAILAPIAGRRLEKQYQNDPNLCRTIALGVVVVELAIFLVWQISCVYLLE